MSRGADWSREFDDSFPVPDGHVLKTLHDAGHDATASPKAVQERPERTMTDKSTLQSCAQHPYAHASSPRDRTLYSRDHRRPPQGAWSR